MENLKMNKLKFIGRGFGYNVKEGNTSVFMFDEGNDIFYSSDTYETNFDIVPFLRAGNIAYHDTCLSDYEGFSVPHALV